MELIGGQRRVLGKIASGKSDPLHEALRLQLRPPPGTDRPGSARGPLRLTDVGGPPRIRITRGPSLPGSPRLPHARGLRSPQRLESIPFPAIRHAGVWWQGGSLPAEAARTALVDGTGQARPQPTAGRAD